MLDLLHRLLARFHRKGKKIQHPKGYKWLLEIRPILEKKLLRLRAKKVAEKLRIPRRYLMKVPHITLIYNFELKRSVAPLSLIQTVARVAENYERVTFYYDGVALRKREQGPGHVLVFNIEPSLELRKLRKEVYEAIKPLIEESSRSQGLNNCSKFWFHATIALGRLPQESISRHRALGFSFFLPSEVWRITLLYRGKIVYEYDHILRRILTRKEALSEKTYAADLTVYCKTRGIEVDSQIPQSRQGLKRVWVTADLHLGHENIIKYTARPFLNSKEMDKILIHNWNTIIAPNDTVYIVGDLAFRRRDVKRYLRILNGKKILIRGNHDRNYACCDRLVMKYAGICFNITT